MKKLISLVIASGALSFGCALEPATMYQVYVDPAFSDSEQAIINAALDDWTTKSNGIVTFHVDVAKSWGTKTPPHTIWIQSSSHSSVNTMCEKTSLVGCTYRTTQDDNAFVYMAVDDFEGRPSMSWFGQAVRHEIGHALLGPEHYEAGTIMAPGHGSASTEVTCKDIKRLNVAHGNNNDFFCVE